MGEGYALVGKGDGWQQAACASKAQNNRVADAADGMRADGAAVVYQPRTDQPRAAERKPVDENVGQALGLQLGA